MGPKRFMSNILGCKLGQKKNMVDTGDDEKSDCDHGEDAGVVCTSGSVRLFLLRCAAVRLL